MIQPEIKITLISPDGPTLDVTDRMDSGGLNAISEQVGEEILELVHSDMDLELRDQDGVVEAFFENAEPEDVFEIRVERETLKRRPKWERVFGGVLELPWSLRFNRKEKTVALQAFGYSKLLERTSAEGVNRGAQAMTGSVSSGTAAVTVSPDTTDLRVGDIISMGTEEHTIESVDSSSQVTTEDNWAATYSGDTLVLETPYYRNKGIEFLVGELLTEAEIDSYDVSLNQQLADFPLHQAMNTDGITSGDPRSIVEEGGQIVATFSAGSRQVADSPQDGFTDGVNDQDCQGDWRPYMDTEPSSIVEKSGATDDGTFAWDHDNGDYYSLVTDIDIDFPTPGLDTSYLNLHKNGVFASTLDSYVSGTHSGYQSGRYLDWTGSAITYSARRDDASGTTVGHSPHSSIRNIDQLSTVAYFNVGTTTMEIAGTEITVPAGLEVWTLRAFGDVLAGVYFTKPYWYVRIWNSETFEVLADHKITAGGLTDQPFLTVFSASTEDIGVGYVNGVYFILAQDFLGVVPYADFDGLSCSAALRELALLSMSVFDVDHYKTGNFRARGTALSADAATVLDTPLERESAPIWEFYRASVKIEGETEAGDEIEVIVGDTGDSARRLELSPQLISTESLAIATANLYLVFLSEQRKQESVTVLENGTIFRTFDRVQLDGRDYMVLEPETDLLSREQSMQLVSV